MKRIISIILLTNFVFSCLTTPAFAATNKKNKMLIKAGVKKEYKKENPKKKEFIPALVEDEFANELKDSGNASHRLKKYKTAILSDEEILMTEEKKNFKKPVYTGQVKTENGIEVVLKPVNKIKTKCKSKKIKDEEQRTNRYTLPQPAIGEKVAFRVVKNVTKGDEIVIPKDTVVYAQIAEVSPRALGGAPAEMTIENFEIMDDNGNLVPLDGQISASGYSLSFWIGLAELATTPFLFGLAVPLLRFLPGGQAVVTPRKNYVVYY